jgi:hypothetical protein
MIGMDQVTRIATTGFWFLVDDHEYFVPFADYPVFRTATVEQIFAVERVGPGQYHWPALDADVELEALEHPDRFPLVWR